MDIGLILILILVILNLLLATVWMFEQYWHWYRSMNYQLVIKISISISVNQQCNIGISVAVSVQQQIMVTMAVSKSWLYSFSPRPVGLEMAKLGQMHIYLIQIIFFLIWFNNLIVFEEDHILEAMCHNHSSSWNNGWAKTWTCSFEVFLKFFIYVDLDLL